MNKTVWLVLVGTMIALVGYSVFTTDTFKDHKALHAIAPAAGKPDDKKAGMPPGGHGPSGPMPVSVEAVAAQKIIRWQEFPSRLSAVEQVAIRPRVSGAIQKIYFNAGDIVQKDAPLFLIDPRPYQAEVNRAQAELQTARAQETLAASDWARAQRLIADKALAQRDYDARKNAQEVAKARIAAAQAALQQAQLNLHYATITAPITGKISRAEITVGNLVAPDMPNALATLVSIDPIYAEFEVDENTYLKSIQQDAQTPDALPVELVLDANHEKIYHGTVQSFDNQINPSSGTLRVRALLKNVDGALVSGMFATLRMGSAGESDAILLSEDKIGMDQNKRFVYLVDKDNKVEYRPVTLGGYYKGKRIIENGLAPGDKVITTGIQRLQPGMPVVPQDATAQPTNPAETQNTGAH